MKPNDAKKIIQGIIELEHKLEVQEGFYKRLMETDSDWLYVIKLHAFLEAACTMLVIRAIGKEELIDVISRSNIHVKLQYIKKLALLSKGAGEFIRELSEIRNIYVHNIKSVSLTLEDYLRQRTPQQKNKFVKIFGYDTKEEITISGVTVKKRDFILENPRFAIHLGTFSVLSEVVAQSELEKIRLDTSELEHRKAELHEKTIKILSGLMDKYELEIRGGGN